MICFTVGSAGRATRMPVAGTVPFDTIFVSVATRSGALTLLAIGILLEPSRESELENQRVGQQRSFVILFTVRRLSSILASQSRSGARHGVSSYHRVSRAKPQGRCANVGGGRWVGIMARCAMERP